MKKISAIVVGVEKLKSKKNGKDYNKYHICYNLPKTNTSDGEGCALIVEPIDGTNEVYSIGDRLVICSLNFNWYIIGKEEN